MTCRVLTVTEQLKKKKIPSSVSSSSNTCNKHFLQSLAGGAADAECNDNISWPPVPKPPTTRSPSIINTGSECKVAIIIGSRCLVQPGVCSLLQLDDNAANKLRQMVKFAGHNSAIVIGWPASSGRNQTPWERCRGEGYFDWAQVS